MVTRQQMWDRLGEPVDVLIIGGGINGAGIARDASMRGLKVALVEMKDLAYGTSSRSSKLVHGGLRYLEQLEFSLVFESVSERRILMDIAPHLVHPLGFLFPVYRGSRRNLTMINAGMWLYEGLSLFRSPKRHRKLRPRDVAEEEPCLTTENLKGAPLYFDCSTDDARLTLETALDAVGHGATVVTWARAVSFLKDEAGRIGGAVVKNAFTGELCEVRAHVVINATGPWTDRTRAMSSEPPTTLLRPTKGVHIVVEREKLPVRNAVVCFHPTDDRVLFAIPWGARTYLGTTDTDYQGDPGDVIATLADIDYLLSAAAAYFPDSPLTRDDVIATWAGLRPLIRASDDVSESAVSREHQIIVSPDGLITIAGGKLTTYRRMSAEVVDTTVKFLRLTNHLPPDLEVAHTESNPLPGAVGWPEDDNHELVAKQVLEAGQGHIEPETARALVFTYGMRSIALATRVAEQPELARPIIDGRPEIVAQIDWSVQEEMATTVTDILIQRTQIFYRDRDQGLGATGLVADRLAHLLGWDEATRANNIAQYEHDVYLSRKWREEIDQSS
ncbi:MAG: glycerol-3-phosphate dehydrogenase [Bradymonadaceae bacterium]|nr:glycerol-3-phosphate dehydrogenase [Lujinxingiaceae bacterium]